LPNIACSNIACSNITCSNIACSIVRVLFICLGVGFSGGPIWFDFHCCCLDRKRTSEGLGAIRQEEPTVDVAVYASRRICQLRYATLVNLYKTRAQCP
jgi:hypothetical protein